MLVSLNSDFRTSLWTSIFRINFAVEHQSRIDIINHQFTSVEIKTRKHYAVNVSIQIHRYVQPRAFFVHDSLE